MKNAFEYIQLLSIQSSLKSTVKDGQSCVLMKNYVYYYGIYAYCIYTRQDCNSFICSRMQYIEFLQLAWFHTAT